MKIVIDADCPNCGYPERVLDVLLGVFECSTANPERCDYVSTERES